MVQRIFRSVVSNYANEHLVGDNHWKNTHIDSRVGNRNLYTHELAAQLQEGSQELMHKKFFCFLVKNIRKPMI